MTEPRRHGRLRATTLRHEAYRAIREAILAGKLAPGAKLVEAELAQRLGVSRNPIREALGRLEQQGLVVSVANRGTFVAQLTPDQMRDALIVRAFLEVLAVRLAMARGGAIDFPGLDRVVGAMRALAGVGDVREVLGQANLLDAQFHGLIVEGAGNEALRRNWDCVAPLEFVFLHDIHSMLHGGWEAGMIGHLADQHAHVVDALKSGDARTAERAIRVHILERTGESSLGGLGLSLLGGTE